MSKFKNGDRVQTVCDNPFLYRKGDTGKVICYRKVDNMYLVRFDDKGSVLREHWLCEENIELLKEKLPTIVITTDGKITVATKRLGKRVLGRCVAVCSDDDEFDFDTGASIALARLVGAKIEFQKDDVLEAPIPAEKKPHGYSGTVVCLESLKDWWTPGKTYEVCDGKIVDDDCCGRDRGRCKDFDDFYRTWWNIPGAEEARFAEVVTRK